MIIVPFNTDAPIYHFPAATIGTIVLNVVLFIPVFLHPDPYGLEAEYGDWDAETEREFDAEYGDDVDEEFAEGDAEEMLPEPGPTREPGAKPIWRLMTLEYGKFRPWQWLTANYMHADIFHLLGNMFVLWGFGLVVEGKVGWWRFLAIYNAIGVAGWCLVQLVMFFADGGIALGASLAIFGLLAVALIWAPANEMSCFMLLGIRPLVFDASILAIASGALFLQVGVSAFHVVTMTGMGLGLRITSEILHLIGAIFGVGVGVVMVKRNLVDCENWDVFSVMAGRHQKTLQQDREEVSRELDRIQRAEKKKLSAAEGPARPVVSGAQLVEQFQQQVAAGDSAAAGLALQRGAQQVLGFQVPEADYVKYVQLLRSQQQWELAVHALEDYEKRYTERTVTMQLARIHILIQPLNRLREAWQLLETINPAFLEPSQKATYDKLRAAAKQRIQAARQARQPRPESH